MNTTSINKIFSAVTVLLAVVFLAVGALRVRPEAMELARIGKVGELESAIKRQFSILSELVENEEKFSDNLHREKIAQSAAMIACLSQAVMDHPDGSQAALPVGDLRESAQEILDAEKYDEVAKALQTLAGQIEKSGPGKTQESEPWDELITMEPLMESLNNLNTALRRTVRRSRDPENDSLDATTGAIMSLVLKADTSYVSDDDVVIWQNFAQELETEYRAIAAAIKKQDTDAAKEHHKAVAQVCTKCHDKFRE